MIPGFGKQTIVIGSAPTCDIVLQAPGVAPEHAHVVHQGGGKLVLIPLGTGPMQVDGRQLTPQSQTPFDFRSRFYCAAAEVPLSHPALVMMLMSRGQLPAAPGQHVIGRDPTRASLVIAHPSVSSQHATVMLDRMQVLDHSSTSGTYVGPNKIAPGTPSPLDPNGILAFGPVPVPVATLMQLAQAFAAAPVVAHASTAAAPPQPSNPQMAPMPQPSAVQQQHAVQPAAQAMGTPGGDFGKKNRTVVGKLGDVGSKDTISIGRTPDNDIQINHPQVSSKHAGLVKKDGRFYLQDLRSANGTFVRGHRLAPGVPVPVENGEKVYIGPMPLVIQVEGAQAQVAIEDRVDQTGWAGRPLYEIEAWGLVVEVPDRDDPGQMKRLLNEVSFKALPGDMIALMGPSGAGKTTLLLTLNGYKPPTGGRVSVNGEDLYAIYDALRGSIGYVPQDDIVHPELTVYEAVYYSARFRLPPDFSEDEIHNRVMATLTALGLEGLAHLEIGRPEKKVLSGGQRKRVNIALELVTDPVILFLDEPTSGLAADDTTALISLLSGLAKSTGKTIIMTIHQPAKDEYEQFNLALILGYGGYTIFFGPTKVESYRFFGTFKERELGQPNDIDNPRDMFDMLRIREDRILQGMRAQNPQVPKVEARKAAATLWAREFAAAPIYKKMYAGNRAIGQQTSRAPVPERAPSTSGQLGLLLSRYFKVKKRDVSGTVIMLAQAPIIGVLLAFVFGKQDPAVPYWCIGALQDIGKSTGQQGDLNQVVSRMAPTVDPTAAIFFLIVSSVFFGTSNAAREIVSERAIYMRERMVNLGLFNYMMSKFILLCLVCVVQCTVLLAIVFPTLGFHGGAVAFGLELANMVSVAVCAVALGLLISTSVESSEAAMALTPIALIPQIVLGGLIVPMTTNSTLKWLMYAIPARWGFQGVVSQERQAVADDPSWVMDLNRPGVTSADNYIFGGKFKCALAQLSSETLNGAWGFSQYEMAWLSFAVLGGMTFFALLLLLILLRRRDPL